MKSIVSSFAKRDRKPNPVFELVVTPTQALIASVVVFVVALWPMLTLQIGRPTGWFGHFLFLSCATSSVLTAPALCVATFIDMVRRRANARLLAAFVFSIAGIVAMVVFIYFRIKLYDHGG